MKHLTETKSCGNYKAKQWIFGSFAALLVGSLSVQELLAAEPTVPVQQASISTESNTAANSVQVTFYRPKGNADYMPTVFLNDRVVGSLRVGQTAQTAVCRGMNQIRVDTRTGKVMRGQANQERIDQEYTYYQISELSGGQFVVRPVTAELARQEITQLQAQGGSIQVINRNTAQCLPPEPKTVVFSADALFAFDRGELLAEGKEKIDAVLQQLRAQNLQITQMTIVGHTDALGTAEYNQVLSEARARTVQRYMVAQGVVSPINATGQGNRQPITQSCALLPKAAQIACYRPDRRVTIEISTQSARAPQ